MQFWVTIKTFCASRCHNLRVLEIVIEALQISFSEVFWMGSDNGFYKNRNTKEKKCVTGLNVAEEFK